MKRALSVALVLLPCFALAADTAPQTVDYSSGIVADWKDVTASSAFALLPLMLVVSFAVEAFGRAPGQPKDFGAVVWRFLLVFVLLVAYQGLFGRIMGLMSEVAGRIPTKDAWAQVEKKSAELLLAKGQYQLRELQGSASLGESVVNWVAGGADVAGGFLLDAAVSLIVLLGEAAHWIVSTLGKVLTLLLYILGPLALAVSVPRGSDVGGRWFRIFISVLSWPILSNIIVALMSKYALDGLSPTSSYDTAYRTIGFAGILCLTAFAAPVVASSLVGGSFHAVGAGLASVGALASVATAGAGAIASGAAGVAKKVGGKAALDVAKGAAGVGSAVVQSSGVVGGEPAGAGASASPQWARQPIASVVPATAHVSPAAEAAQGRDIVDGGGVEFPRMPAQPKAVPSGNDGGGAVVASSASPGGESVAPAGGVAHPSAAPEGGVQPSSEPAVDAHRSTGGVVASDASGDVPTGGETVRPGAAQGAAPSAVPARAVAAAAAASAPVNWAAVNPSEGGEDDVPTLKPVAGPAALPPGRVIRGIPRGMPSRGAGVQQAAEFHQGNGAAKRPQGLESWVSNEAFYNWKRANPQADWGTPAAREALMAEEQRLQARRVAGPRQGLPGAAPKRGES